MGCVIINKTTRTMLHAAYNFTCVYCNVARSTTLDHIVPLACNGAKTNLENLVPACRKCNEEKGCTLLDKEIELHLQIMANKVAKDIRTFYRNVQIMIAFAEMYNNPPQWKLDLKMQLQKV